jgi:hypothetical protein
LIAPMDRPTKPDSLPRKRKGSPLPSPQSGLSTTTARFAAHKPDTSSNTARSAHGTASPRTQTPAASQGY